MIRKRIFASILALALICSCLTACSSGKSINVVEEEGTRPVVEIEDTDDGVPAEEKTYESNTFELKDINGNTLTLIPVYNTDGKTVIAGYIQSVKDKDGKALDQKGFALLKGVIAIDTDDKGGYSIHYNDKKEFVVLKAYSDDKGYIIAIQDALDIDKDKDIKEYFKVVSKLDSNKNLFIKLDSDKNGKPINVEVKESDDKKDAEITDETGKKTNAKDTQDNTNIKDVTDKEKDKAKEEDKKNKDKNKNPSSPQSPDSPESPDNPTTPTSPDAPTSPESPTQQEQTPTEPELDYTYIVLKKGGKYSTNGTNITDDGSLASGGTEIKISGMGKPSGKYYVTSETDSFLGQLEFDLSVGDEIEVKLNDVGISTARKTALKFVNLDSDDEKESDAETGTDSGQTGNDKVSSAPIVDLSFTGTNKIKASGSGKNGTIYSECKLNIKGHGSAEIDGGDSLSGICTTESVTIKNATLKITSRAKQGISCDKKVTVNSGAKIDITSMGDCIHCNKFELDGSKRDGSVRESSLNLESMSDAQGKDGIDADNEIIIKGGKLRVQAFTPGKIAIKIRKIEDESDRGVFAIRGGSVIASGYLNTVPSECSQKTVMVTYAGKESVVITAGSHKSVQGAKSFICSPEDTSTISCSSGSTATVKWKGNLGTAITK